MKKILNIAAIIAMMFPAGAVLAQPGMGGPPGPPPPPPPMARERFQQMQMWKLTEVLEMSDEQAAKFFPMFNSFQKSVDKIRQENDDLFDKLDGYLKAEEKGKISGIIGQIEENEAKILDTRKKFRGDIGKVLDEIQIGKMVHFQREFPRRFRDAMWDFKGEPGRGPRWNDDKPGRDDAPIMMGMGNGPNCRMRGENRDCPCW